MSWRSRLVIADVTMRPLRSITGWWIRATKSAATSGFAPGPDQFGTPPRGATQRLGLAPCANLAVIAAQQNRRHAHPAKFFRPRVLWIFEQVAVAEGFLFERFGIAH